MPQFHKCGNALYRNRSGLFVYFTDKNSNVLSYTTFYFEVSIHCGMVKFS